MTHTKNYNEFNRSLLRAINASSPDGILVVDNDDKIISVNKRFFTVWDIPYVALRDEGMHNTPDEPILQQAVSRVVNPEAFLSRVRQLYANPKLEDICEIQLKDGRTLERHSTSLAGNDGRYLGRVWYFRDVSAYKNLENELRHLADTDPLTGVANRRKFFHRANEEFVRARRTLRALAVIMLDIDYFKEVNDCWGHDAGDRVLQETSSAWGQALRTQDVLARLGGEEFAVLLPDTDLHAALETAKRLAHTLEQLSLNAELCGISCTASAGVAELRAEDSDFDDCLRRADAALYRAKRMGRHRIEVEDCAATPPIDD